MVKSLSIFLLFITIFHGSNSAFAETIYICNNMKVEKPWIGKNRFFWEDRGRWQEAKDSEISSDRVISYGWESDNDTCLLNNIDKPKQPRCDHYRVISLIPQRDSRGNNQVTVKEYVSGNNCYKSELHFSVNRCTFRKLNKNERFGSFQCSYQKK
jgi:hypothetical protein